MSEPVSLDRLQAILTPYWGASLPEPLATCIHSYLALLIRWNARTNLSSIREPEAILHRHFGESLFCARHLPRTATLLDVGSGAGFPGMVLAFAHPQSRVTLAESQGKKATFLREVARQLCISVEVWGKRLEEMPGERRFDIVTLRAVDRPELAERLARERLEPGGLLAHLRSGEGDGGESLPIPNSDHRFLHLTRP